MVALNRIYTKTGDDGTSGLADGSRRPKSDLRFEAIGTVDETNAAIGLARLEAAAIGDLDAALARIQNDLFDLGADLATPGEKGVANFRALQNNKVRVTVMTNSLAATDEPLVHNGYARYRPGLLDAGVDLYELSPTRVQRTDRLGMFDRAIGRLHAKTAVIDREQVFIGSMNLDPRSANANTELGMFVDSPRLARELIRVVNISKLDGAYRVRRDEKTQALQWLTTDGDKEVILLVEPESTFWGRVKNAFYGFFVPEQLL